MELFPMENKSRSEQVAQRILRMIADGTLQEGDKLPSEPEFAKQLGISRGILREGLAQLKAQGVIRRKPEIRYKPQLDIERLPEVQKRILRGLASCVKPGGTLLYSTCTVLYEENEQVVEDFLRENPDFCREEMKTLWPHINGTDGFFICRMRHNG